LTGSKKIKHPKTKTFMETSFSRERGLLWQDGQVSWLELQTYLPRLPTRRLRILDFRFWIEPNSKT
jgi:hypothetical protein